MSNNKEMVCPVCGSPVELYINEFGEYVYCTAMSLEILYSKLHSVQ